MFQNNVHLMFYGGNCPKIILNNVLCYCTDIILCKNTVILSIIIIIINFTNSIVIFAMLLTLEHDTFNHRLYNKNDETERKSF